MNGIKRSAFEGKRKLHSDDKVPYSKGREFIHAVKRSKGGPHCIGNLIDFQKTWTSKADSICKNSWHTLHPSKITNKTMSVFTWMALYNYA